MGVSALTFSSPRGAQIQIVSGDVLGVQVCGRYPALLLCCADEPPTWRGEGEGEREREEKEKCERER